MKKVIYRLFLTVLLVILYLFTTSCSSTPERKSGLVMGIDDLVHTIAEKSAAILPNDSPVTLAVYYFTVDGKPSNISSYLINGVTTEIANLWGSNLTMVSRQGLDRIMKEHSFMLTDLVSEETQVNLGQLLGADMVLTGYITPLKDYSKINIQLIDVETGAVKGGFQLDYKLEKDFKKDKANVTMPPADGIMKIEGVTTTTTVIDNFDGPVTRLNFTHYEESWGNLFPNKSADAYTKDGMAVLSFKADLDSSNLLKYWNDSDLNFYISFQTNKTLEGTDGVSLDLTPKNFSQVEIFLTQNINGEDRVFGTHATLNPGEPNHLQIPYNVLKDFSHTGPLKEDLPLTLNIGVPFGENYELFQLEAPNKFSGVLNIDNIGLFSFNSVERTDVIESFEDEVSRAVPLLEISNGALYMDYNASENGTLKINNGIDNAEFSIKRLAGGPAGTYLESKGHFDITKAMKQQIDMDHAPGFILVFNIGKSLSKGNTITWLMRSDVFKSGYLQVMDADSGQSYESSFNLHEQWGKITIPFRQLVSDNSNMKETPLLSDKLQLIYVFPFENKDLLSSIDTGSLDFYLDIDQILVE